MGTFLGRFAVEQAVVMEQAVDIARSPEAVFDYASDPLREPEWNPRMRRVAKLGDGPLAVGARYAEQFISGSPLVAECVRCERPTAWAMVGESILLAAGFAGEVRPAPGGARLALRMELWPRGPLRLALPLLRRRMRRELARHTAAIKARLES